MATPVRVLAGVVQQIAEHLLHAGCVTLDDDIAFRQHRDQLMAALLHERRVGQRNVAQQLDQGHGLATQGQLPPRDARDVHQVIDQPRHGGDLAIDHLQ
ncbi:hypothetical protein D3C71_1880930 [compost metagenome]